MNASNEPTNPNVPPLPTDAASGPAPEPLPCDAPPGVILQTLLKRPAQLIAALQQLASGRLALFLAVFALLALAAYGAVVGSFSGGQQWLAAPLKVSLGALVSTAICLPSLFIFSCLAGAEVTLRGIVGTLSAALALTALMLIGLAPVGWVFSQSTDSVVFMGAMHLVFWFISLAFGFRLLRLLLDYLGVRKQFHLKMWLLIFVFVSLQMTTALRPLIGTSTDWLPKEKKFFAAYWIENLNQTEPSHSKE